jgi:uncharacterized integral membrane protein
MTDTPSEASTPQLPSTAEPVLTETHPQHPAGRTRISGVWVGVIVAALVLVLLLVFILENTKSVRISYFTAHGEMPLGAALLLAAVGGVLLAGVVASLRIWQLRHRLKNPDQSAGVGRPTRYRGKPKAV